MSAQYRLYRRIYHYRRSTAAHAITGTSWKFDMGPCYASDRVPPQHDHAPLFAQTQGRGRRLDPKPNECIRRCVSTLVTPQPAVPARPVRTE